MDAPAGGQTKKDPFPALLRIKHEAILPNAGLMDLRECFMVASAYGDLSSERVYLRAEGISCQRADGAILEAPIDAYASGIDGRAGVRGRVVEKTGQLIARSLTAGFVEGMAKAFKPQQSTNLNLNPQNGAQATFQYPDPSFVLGGGLLGGGAGAAERIGNIYEDLAKSVVPVIEIDAGIKVDFIMTRGSVLTFKQVSEIAAMSARGGLGGAIAGATRGLSGSGAQGNPGPASLAVTPLSGSYSPPPSPAGGASTFTHKR